MDAVLVVQHCVNREFFVRERTAWTTLASTVEHAGCTQYLVVRCAMGQLAAALYLCVHADRQ
eukprot:scaffold179372_cov31-Tisochrysis_lutea.AAC.3